jgi:signal peptidase I
MTTVVRSRKSRLRSEAAQILLLLALMLTFRSSFADHYYVPSGSMEYSLLPGDRVVVDKRAYGLRIPLTTIDIVGGSGPSRGDIAVFDSPTDGTRLIKRIAAVGGDTVSLIDGQLRVNGRSLGDAGIELFDSKPAYLNLNDGGGPDIESLEIPAGMVLALGDHRGNSLDGRFFGLISEQELVGRAVGIYYRREEGFVWKPL